MITSRGFQLGLNLENKHFSEQNAIYVDVKSEKCPDNVSIVMGHLRKAKPKSIVLVEATDQNTQKDIPAMCSALDYTLIAQLESESIFSFLIEK
ncbi:hypothetical protein C0W66_21115 [Photobacterium kishitanii]|nr:hypothetical protein C0W66_21115 [Photobacterium kishitanii]